MKLAASLARNTAAARNLLRLAEPPEQVLRAGGFARLLHRAEAIDEPVGLDRARRQRVHPDLLRGVVHRHRLGELDQGALGRAVRDAPRRADAAELGGDVDDRPAPGALEVRDRELAHQERAAEIDREHPVPVRGIAVHHGRIGIEHGRAVDEHVQATEAGDRVLDRAPARRLVGDVACDRCRATTCGLDEVCGRLRACGIHVARGHGRAGAGERNADRPADPAAGPGHDRGLAVEPELVVSRRHRRSPHFLPR